MTHFPIPFGSIVRRLAAPALFLLAAACGDGGDMSGPTTAERSSTSQPAQAQQSPALGGNAYAAKSGEFGKQLTPTTADSAATAAGFASRGQ